MGITRRRNILVTQLELRKEKEYGARQETEEPTVHRFKLRVHLVTVVAAAAASYGVATASPDGGSVRSLRMRASNHAAPVRIRLAMKKQPTPTPAPTPDQPPAGGDQPAPAPTPTDQPPAGSDQTPAPAPTPPPDNGG
jgi:hypothetical protein